MSAVMPSDPNRAFNYAILASIVLHGILLFGFSQRDAARRAAPPAPIIARLVQPPPDAVPVPVAAPIEPVKPQARPVKPQAGPAKPKPTRSEPVPAPEPVAEAPPAAPPVPAAPAAAPAAPAAAPPVVARVVPSPAPASPSVEAVDAGSLAQYRLQLIATAPRYKRYPPVARDNNWEGRVALRLVIGASGTVSASAVTKSSGHAVLDQQALEMFSKAAAAVQVPPVLRGKEFAVELAAAYYFTE